MLFEAPSDGPPDCAKTEVSVDSGVSGIAPGCPNVSQHRDEDLLLSWNKDHVIAAQSEIGHGIAILQQGSQVDPDYLIVAPIDGATLWNSVSSGGNTGRGTSTGGLALRAGQQPGSRDDVEQSWGVIEVKYARV